MFYSIYIIYTYYKTILQIFIFICTCEIKKIKMEKNVIFMLRVVKKFVKIRWRKKPEKRFFPFLDNMLTTRF